MAGKERKRRDGDSWERERKGKLRLTLFLISIIIGLIVLLLLKSQIELFVHETWPKVFFIMKTMMKEMFSHGGGGNA